jgi:uncharacterized protein with NAD-binding domain and iron-sulfur cluster
MKTKVAIFGGGVAGMSAAHELIERGFEVEVYERQPAYVGGKARSVDVPSTSINGSKPLPGEHGFRFFPGFYKHITDTMKRIPFPGNSQGVFDNLTSTSRTMLARFGKTPITTIVNFPKNRADLRVAIDSVTQSDTGLTDANKELFVHKLWQLLTSSYERRMQEYERISWWQYMETDQQCGGLEPCPYEEYCVGGLTHTLVAAQPKLMSTKTGGDILLQLMLLMTNPGARTDRILNGPTNETWLFPWLQHLTQSGVRYHHGHEVKEFLCDPVTRTISGARVEELSTATEKIVKADYYISAVPLERMVDLVSEDMLSIDGSLDFLFHLAKTDHWVDKVKTKDNPMVVQNLNWMNGIQYFLKEDIPLANGHIIFIDSPWAVTAISQAQFWPGFDWKSRYDGTVKGVLSVDVSNWFNKGLNGKAAYQCTLDEIKEEVWKQMEKSLNVDGKKLLDIENVAFSSVDTDIEMFTEPPQQDTETVKAVSSPPVEKPVVNPFESDHNSEPLLVNVANTWSKRPEAHTNFTNFFLAADYVRTHTDLATMEGANEAARRAVNGILIKSGSDAPHCEIWKLHEPWLLAPLRWLDKRRYEKGLPWRDEVPWVFKWAHEVVHLFHRVFKGK